MRQCIFIYIMLVIGTSKHKLSLFEKSQLNLHCNFVDVVQSNRTNLADGNDIIADWTSKRSAVLPPQSTDAIIGKLRFPLCNSICDIETEDSASVLINDEDANFDDEVDEQPTSLVQEHIKRRCLTSCTGHCNRTLIFGNFGKPLN